MDKVDAADELLGSGPPDDRLRTLDQTKWDPQVTDTRRYGMLRSADGIRRRLHAVVRERAFELTRVAGHARRTGDRRSDIQSDAHGSPL
jgi:hypothetical protein